MFDVCCVLCINHKKTEFFKCIGISLYKHKQTMVQVRLQDGIVSEFPDDLIHYSATIQNLYNDLSESDEKIINIFEVSHDVLTWIIKYLRLKDEEKNCKFFDAPDDVLFNIFIQSNFLDIKDILVKCGQAIGNIIRNNSINDLRDRFGIKYDLTPEELEGDNPFCFTAEEDAAIQKEHGWLE
jgi:hypothetical protein